MKKSDDDRWFLELGRVGKLLVAATSIYVGWCGAAKAIFNEDNWNGFLAIFSTWPASYLLVTYVLAKFGRMPLRRWPLQTVMLHLYTNAFMTFLTALSAACCLLIGLMLTAHEFDESTGYFLSTCWLIHAFVWQVALAVALRRAAELQHTRLGPDDYWVGRKKQRKRSSFPLVFGYPRYSRSTTYTIVGFGGSRTGADET